MALFKSVDLFQKKHNIHTNTASKDPVGTLTKGIGFQIRFVAVDIAVFENNGLQDRRHLDPLNIVAP